MFHKVIKTKFNQVSKDTIRERLKLNYPLLVLILYDLYAEIIYLHVGDATLCRGGFRGGGGGGGSGGSGPPLSYMNDDVMHTAYER